MALMAILRCLLRRTVRLPMPDAAAAHEDRAPPSLQCVCLSPSGVSTLVIARVVLVPKLAGQAVRQCHVHASPWFDRQDIVFGKW